MFSETGCVKEYLSHQTPVYPGSHWSHATSSPSSRWQVGLKLTKQQRCMQFTSGWCRTPKYWNAWLPPLLSLHTFTGSSLFSPETKAPPSHSSPSGHQTLPVCPLAWAAILPTVWAHWLTLNVLLSGLLQEAGSDAQSQVPLQSLGLGCLPQNCPHWPRASSLTIWFLRASPLVDAPCRVDILPLSSWSHSGCHGTGSHGWTVWYSRHLPWYPAHTRHSIKICWINLMNSVHSQWASYLHILVISSNTPEAQEQVLLISMSPSTS